MSFLYWLSKFSQEAMLVELLLIACVTASYFGFLLIQKRRYGVAKKNIPDHVVRAFLVELLSFSEGFKNQLFGDEFKILAGKGLSVPAEPTVAASGVDAGELAAIRAALATSTAKVGELTALIAALTKDKSGLEARLAAAPASSAGGGADPKALADANDKIGKLESKLAEYEVIEDDLANLKKYQQENKQLRAQLEAGGKTPNVAPPAAAAPVAAPTAPAMPSLEPAVSAASPAPSEQAESASPVAAAEESAAASKA
ncbi:MAG: hypothetical protein HY075_10370, partial [Deltaproteobacteria bacterium]|nr:hypothetical protein [Deltaproteobacteria bacterium]